MHKIKRRYFFHLSGSILSVLGLNQLIILQQDKRYSSVLAQGTTKSLRAELQTKGFSGSPISMREVAKKLELNPPISVKQLINIKKPNPTKPTKPNITFDGSTLKFNGSGFLPNAKVYIRVVVSGSIGIASDLRQGFTQVSANSQGSVSTNLDIIAIVPSFVDTVTGFVWNGCYPGETLSISANDGRSDSSDLTGTLWSNTYSITCGQTS